MQKEIEIDLQPQILTPRCSCPKCDSFACMTKRRTDEPCTCASCKNSKFCIFYNMNTKISDSSGSINSQDVEREVTENKELYHLNKIDSGKSLSNTNSRAFYGQLKNENHIDSNDIANSEVEVSVTCSGKKICLSAAKLSAQIMDLPYKDFQNSYKPNLSTKIMNTSPFDIFNRIKEAYRACSCKFCECIVGKSLRNDICRCKPCDCNDCANLKKNAKQIPGDGCPCIRCTRGSCKGIVKKSTGANECDCVGLLQRDHNYSNDISQTCNCVPCQCIDCKFSLLQRNKTLIVAPVEGHQQPNTCLCSPCECFDCRHNGLRNQHHEMSTNVNRHPHCQCEMCVDEACVPDGNQSCRCDRQSRVMRKPFQRDTYDYDIRRANVKYDRSKSNTIAMFAITNAWHNSEKNINQCDCDDCECLQCQYKESPSYDRKIYNRCEPIEINVVSHDCSCDPCECQICAKNTTNSKRYNSCRCEICDCIKCGIPEHCKTAGQEPNKTKQPKNEYSATGNCECNPCMREDCAILTPCSRTICQSCKCDRYVTKENSSEKDIIYPIKKGERLTPTIFRKKTEDDLFESRTLESFKHHTTLKCPSAFSAFQSTKTIVHKQNPNLQHFNRRFETVKCAQNFSTDEKGVTENMNMNLIEKSNEMSRKNENVTHISRPFYCQNSYNDYPSGILKFPSPTAKTCLNDVMQFDSFIVNDCKQKTKKQMYSVGKPQYRIPKTEEEKKEVEKTYGSELEPVIESNIYANNLSDSVSLIKDAKDVLRNHGLHFENYSNEKDGNSVFKYNPSINNKHDITSEVTIDLNNLKLVELYERVQKTLHEARMFSTQLVELVNRYEKANQEFESVPGIIKRPHNSKPDSNDQTGWKKIQFVTDEVPIKEVKANISIGSLIEELVDINGNENSVDEMDIMSENLNNSKGISNCFEELTDIKEEKGTINEESRLKHIIKNKKYIKELHRKYNKIYKRSRFYCNRMMSATNHIKVDASIATEDVKKPIQKEHRNFTTNGNNINIHENEKCLQPINNSIKQSTTSLTEKYSDHAKSQHLLHKEFKISMLPNIERETEVLGLNSEKSWLMKKNVSLNNNAAKANQRLMLNSPLEQSIKDTVHAIMLQQETENATYIYENKALVKLHSEVRKLLNLPILQKTQTNNSVEKTRPDNWMKSLLQNKNCVDDVCNAADDVKKDNIINGHQQSTSTNTRKCCDSFKVNSLNVRRVSDHTVLVKWDVPHSLENVTGYELLVDGRAVQKILSPSRRMAVVTCLPHTDRILLTVRTVINRPCHHLSACTVIYQPRHRVY